MRPGAGPGLRPGIRLSLSSRKSVDVEDRQETSLPWRPARATSSSSDAATVRAFARPGQRVGEGDRSSHSSALRYHRRRAEPGDRGRHQVGDGDQQCLLSVSIWCSPVQPNVSTPTHASTPPSAATTSGRSAPVIAVPSGVEPSGRCCRRDRAPRGGPGARVGGDLRLEARNGLLGDAQGDQELEAVALRVLREHRGHRGAGHRRRRRLDDYRKRRVQVGGARQGSRAGRKHGKRDR